MDKKSNIKQIVQEILDSKLSYDTSAVLIENLGEGVEEVLQDIKLDTEFDRIMKKPLMTGWDIINFPSEPNDYLIENFLWRNSISIICGQEKACKSIITSQKGMAMTCGEPFLGCFDVIQPLKVLYIQAEGSVSETKERFVSATKAKGLKWNPDNWRHYSPAFLCLDTPEGYNDVVSRINADGFRPDVIIIDPLYTSVTPGKSLNSDELIRPFCGNLRRLQNKYKCAIIIVHHEHRPKLDKFNNKLEEGDNAIFGSSMLKNFASHVLRISIVNERGNPIAPEKEENSDVKYRKLACATQRNGNVVKKVMLRLVEDPLMLEIMDSKPSSSTEESVLKCIENHDKICALDVSEITGINNNTVLSTFRKLVEKKLIKKCGKHGHKVLYCSIKEKEV